MQDEEIVSLSRKVAELEFILGKVISQLGFDTLVDISESKLINKKVVAGYTVSGENDAAIAKIKNRKVKNKHTTKAREEALRQDALFLENAKAERDNLRGLLNNGEELSMDQMSRVLAKIKSIKSAYNPFSAFNDTDLKLQKLKTRTQKNVVVSKAVQEAKRFVVASKGKKLTTVKKRDIKLSNA